MSEELKKRLYDYEETPPVKMWDQIAASLDEEINAAFPQKLYQAEIVPPGAIWNKIALTLDAGVTEEYPAKLYNLEIPPPAATWQKISSTLDEEESLPRISGKGKVIPFAKYAVAVCVIGLIAFGVKFLYNGDQTSIATHETPKAIPVKPSQPGDNKGKEEEQPVQATNNLPKPKIVLASVNEPSKKHYNQTGYMTALADESSLEQNQLREDNFYTASLRGSVPGSQSFINPSAERYLTLTGPDGFLIRVSRKLAETLGCLYTTTDSEEYKKCVEQIKKWRDKLAQSPVTPSPLDLIKSIQENEL